jgi:hypothetical protein
MSPKELISATFFKFILGIASLLSFFNISKKSLPVKIILGIPGVCLTFTGAKTNMGKTQEKMRVTEEMT